MKMLIASVVLLGSSVSMAASNEKLISACTEVGSQKVIEQAAAYGCVVDLKTIRVSEVDNRWYNPSKYVWFTGRANCGAQGLQDITKLTQYYNGHCF